MDKIDQLVSNRLKERRSETKKEDHMYNKLVSNRIKERRKALGMTAKDLGDAIDVTPEQILKYEGNEQNITPGRLYVIAKFLKAPIDYFFKKSTKEEDS